MHAHVDQLSSLVVVVVALNNTVYCVIGWGSCLEVEWKGASIIDVRNQYDAVTEPKLRELDRPFQSKFCYLHFCCYRLVGFFVFYFLLVLS